MPIKQLSAIILILILPIGKLFAASNGGGEPSAQLYNLTIKVLHARSNHGKIMALLFRNKDGFPDDQVSAHRQGTALINNNDAEIVFRNLEPGVYAIALFHDENNDSILNKHWYGKPKEGVATSNDVMHKLSAPTFEECSFKFNGDRKISLPLHYFDD